MLLVNIIMPAQQLQPSGPCTSSQTHLQCKAAGDLFSHMEEWLCIPDGCWRSWRVESDVPSPCIFARPMHIDDHWYPQTGHAPGSLTGHIIRSSSGLRPDACSACAYSDNHIVPNMAMHELHLRRAPQSLMNFRGL